MTSCCKCGHQIRVHSWNFTRGSPQPCHLCGCEDYIDIVSGKDNYEEQK